jgi:hypothetical protein
MCAKLTKKQRHPLQISKIISIFISNMTASCKNNRSTDLMHEARSDVTFGGKDTLFTRKDTPSSLRIYSHTLACHPFAVGKGGPNLYGEAGYPYGYIRNNAVVCVQTGFRQRKFTLSPLGETSFSKFKQQKQGVPMKIGKFNLLHLRNDAHFQFHTEQAQTEEVQNG